MASVNILPHLDSDVIELFEQLGNRRGCKDVFFSTFPRFGFSGSKLYLLYFQAVPAVPFLFKVSTTAKAKEEYEAVERLKNLSTECELPDPRHVENAKLGGILYRHVGTDKPDHAEEPLAFREILFQSEGKFPAKDLENVIREAYYKLDNLHQNAQWRKVLLKETYDRYFRRHKSKVRISQILGANASANGLFNFIGKEIYNPLKLVEELPEEICAFIGWVHGDLHPDNIILEHRTKTARLVDFAWANNTRDILVDFVLLENSIRFRDFPKCVNLDEQAIVDELLLNEDPHADIVALSFSSPTNKAYYGRLAFMVGLIRQKAKSTLGKGFSMERYLFAQFVVLYGLLCFDGYEPYSSTRALGLIAKRLKNTGWGFLHS